MGGCFLSFAYRFLTAEANKSCTRSPCMLCSFSAVLFCVASLLKCVALCLVELPSVLSQVEGCYHFSESPTDACSPGLVWVCWDPMIPRAGPEVACVPVCIAGAE